MQKIKDLGKKYLQATAGMNIFIVVFFSFGNLLQHRTIFRPLMESWSSDFSFLLSLNVLMLLGGIGDLVFAKYKEVG